jgi:hypothetical protein
MTHALRANNAFDKENKVLLLRKGAAAIFFMKRRTEKFLYKTIL